MSAPSGSIRAKGLWLATIAAGFAVLLCFGALQTQLPAFEGEEFSHPRGFGHPVIALEFVRVPADVEPILGSVGARASRLANLRSVQDLDRFFPVFYAAFLLLLAAALHREADVAGRGAGSKSRLVLAMVAAVLAALADYGENAMIARLLGALESGSGAGSVSEQTFGWLGAFARLKFGLLGVHALCVSPSLRIYGWLGRFAGLAANASFVVMALGVAWPARLIEPANALLALFWLSALGLSIRLVTHSDRDRS